MLPQLPLTVGPAVATGESAAADSAVPRRPSGEAPADPFAGLLAGLRVAAATQADAGGKGLPSDGGPLPPAEGPLEALLITAPVAGPVTPATAAGLPAESAPLMAPISPGQERLAATSRAAPGLSIALAAPGTGGTGVSEAAVVANAAEGLSSSMAGPWPRGPAQPAADPSRAVPLPAGAAPAAEGEARIPVPFAATGVAAGEADSAGTRPGIRPGAAAPVAAEAPPAPAPSASAAARDLMAAAESSDADTRRSPLPGSPVAAAQSVETVASQRADVAPLPALSHLSAAHSSADSGASTRPTALAYNLAGAQGDFAEGLAGQVRIIVGTASREATMQLHPAELGRLHVTINTDGDQARVVFVTDTAHARDAIEQSLPRLRDLLQQSGLDLAEGDVSYREPQQHARGDGGQRDGLPGTPGGNDPAALAAEAQEGRTSRSLALRVDGLLDTFA